MKLKLLLFSLLLSVGVLYGQNDTIRGLIITEANLNNGARGFLEITNMGDEAVDLSVIEFAEMRPWGEPPWEPPSTRRFFLPEFMLEPGESYVVTGATDWGPMKFAEGLEGYPEKGTNDDMWDLADYLIHVDEINSGPGDSITDDNAAELFTDLWGGRSCLFIRQHINETDSVVLDQVNGWFDGDNGLNIDQGGYDIAGVTQASANSYLIRKYSVKEGNLDFASAAGIGEFDGEWIVVPKQGGVWRRLPWTIGNHGDYKLNGNTLESDVADIDFVTKTITVPWGTRRPDGVMELMKWKPGLAWNYHLAPIYEDSLSFACTTGDTLELVVAGEQGYRAEFTIEVAEPTADANMVVPVTNWDPNGDWRDDIEQGIIGWPRVTAHETGPDTIWGVRGGIPYATRVDTLMERLEKPANADWEIVWVDGVERPDLKDGDKLRVTAQDGSVKDYHISVLPIRADDDAQLTAITWPDIPDFYKGIFGWIGDTIPNFSSTVYNYRVQVPLDVDGIPALVATKSDPNAKVTVQRATNLAGTPEDRSIMFTVQAESDTTFRFYNVELVKEKNPINVQPYHAEPFLSEFVFWEQWSNSMCEICNPGNQPLDLSDYMFAMQWNTDPAGVIQSRMGEDEWLDRYDKYVPGYKWVSEAQWAVTPGILEQDLNVNPIVLPGDVFVMAGVWTTSFSEGPFWWDRNYDWPVDDQWDVQFNNHSGTNVTYENPWGEQISGNGSPVRKWHNSNWYMYKILNDSIKQGLKPANDPNDFELIEAWGMADGTDWAVGGPPKGMITNYMRKPEFFEGNPEMQASFGTNEDDTEWTWTNQAYWNSLGAPWPNNILSVGYDLGQHFFNSPTHYMSTISSTVYKVSEGYGRNGTTESIRGMTPGVTAGDFLNNLIKADEGQTLTVTSMADGSELAMDALLSNMDTLTVLSADSTNTTQYELIVAEQGLSSNAVLTSQVFDITYEEPLKSAAEAGEAGEGMITGFEYGTSVRTVVENITVPAGALMDIVDGEGAYVPLTMLNYDTTYVDVIVNNNVYFDVLAENGITRIVYQLVPDVKQTDAFITSDVYDVIQKDFLIKYVPGGVDVESFLANLVPSTGATMMVVNKMGQERMDGYIADDDKVIVTSPDGTVSNVYLISRLSTRFVPGGTYLAYILSDVYNVDQVNYHVTGVSGTVAQFLANVTPAMGATAVVVDASGMEKASGNVDGGDMVKVTSADGKIVAMYELTTVGAGYNGETQIVLYPNPTEGRINVTGVEVGNRIQVFNTMGAAIRDISVQSTNEVISLYDQPVGMYMIVISDNDKPIGRYKALKR